ncbi:MAG: hypothetical protein ACI8S6_005694 [Myxococcota bacterium]|jgi:hypothetical protein
MISLSRLVPALVVFAPALAHAGEREEAEHTRLTEEMSRLAGRNAWRGVENSYQKMVELERKGVTLVFQDHFMAAQAASNLGDITATHARAGRAREVAASPEERQQAAGWMADIEASYGPVVLRVPPRYADAVTFDVATMPFNPEHRAVYQKARAAIMSGEGYQGLLPLGQYAFGDQSFEIMANSDFSEPVRVVFGDASAEPDQLIAYAGPRLDLGGAMSAAGTPSGAGEPQAFSGAGLRAGLGVEVGLRGGLGALVEVGYHSIAAGEGEDPSGVEVDGTGLTVSEAYGVQATSTALRAGYTWLAATWRPAPWLSLAAGPVYAIGAGSAQGTTGESDLSSYASVNGQIRAGGGSAAVTYVAPVTLGPLGLGISALGGAQSDTSRWYTWGQLALTITPVGREG